MRYTSDLTDKEWEILKELLPRRDKTRPMNWEYREIINGILYQLKNGCSWVNIPKDLPPYSTLYWHYKQLKKEGVIEVINQELHKLARAKAKKK
jgi:transposase